jgi:hypothetical protein
MRVMARKTRGQGLLEVCAGMMILIPISLFMLDMMVLVTTNVINDAAAKNAARAAANQSDLGAAKSAALKALQAYKKSTIITDLTLDDFTYPQSKDGVSVRTKMSVHLPGPFTSGHILTLLAQDVEPIVAQ